MVPEKLGVKLKNIPLKTVCKAVQLKQPAKFKENVLMNYWIETGEFIFHNDDNNEVRRLERVRLKDIDDIETPEFIAEDCTGRISQLISRKKTIPHGRFTPVLQNNILLTAGSFGNLTEVVPQNGETDPNGDNYWTGVGPCDKYKIFAISCAGNSGVKGVIAGTRWPVGDKNSFRAALAVATDENPNR